MESYIQRVARSLMLLSNVLRRYTNSDTTEEWSDIFPYLQASSLNPKQVELSRKQFGVEMNILTRYLHKNIVRLLGFSSDGPELCLIYEYMQNGALSHRLDCKVHSRTTSKWLNKYFEPFLVFLV